MLHGAEAFGPDCLLHMLAVAVVIEILQRSIAKPGEQWPRRRHNLLLARGNCGRA
jgi:hypothetical protein